VGQPKCAAWVTKYNAVDTTQASLDEQVADIATFIDPVFTGTASSEASLDSVAYTWVV